MHSSEITFEQILAEWDRFKATVQEKPGFRKVTLDAWKRCKDVGLTPEQLKHRILSEDELAKKLAENAQLVQTTKPFLEQIVLSFWNVPCVIALSDSEGWILDIHGAVEEFGGRDTGIWIGASWAEEHIGNNGIGTTLATQEPTLVYGIEHFGAIYHAACCLGVPLKDPAGRIVGALDLSIIPEYAIPERYSLFLVFASFIEKALFPEKSAPVYSVEYKEVGAQIRKIRKEQKLSQKELAKEAKLAQSYISQVENDHQSPTLRSLQLIAQALGVTVEELLGA